MKRYLTILTAAILPFFSSVYAEPWSEARQEQLVQEANALQSEFGYILPKKSYPVSEEDLQEIYRDAKGILFFAYSSMIDKESGAVKAISAEAAATQIPAIAFGIQRTFNREMLAAIVEAGWGALQRPNDLAILNVFEKQDAALNGVLFRLPLSDLLTLSKREVGYDLIPVVVTLWSDAIDEQKEPQMLLAYTFRAPDNTGYTSANVNPIPGYLNFLQKGVNLFGDDFSAMWWTTTYLADQETLVSKQ